jgi:colicin import membrane protein
MARTPKTLTKAELKAKTAELKEAAKKVNETFAPFASDLKAAEKALAGAKKAAEKALAEAKKAVAAALKKHDKASDARTKGLAKIASEQAKLAPAATTEA